MDATPDNEWDDAITFIPWFGREVHRSSRVIAVKYMQDLPLMAIACANGRCALYTVTGSLFAVFGSADRWPAHASTIRRWLKQRDAVVATDGFHHHHVQTTDRNIFRCDKPTVYRLDCGQSVSPLGLSHSGKWPVRFGRPTV